MNSQILPISYTPPTFSQRVRSGRERKRREESAKRASKRAVYFARTAQERKIAVRRRRSKWKGCSSPNNRAAQITGMTSGFSSFFLFFLYLFYFDRLSARRIDNRNAGERMVYAVRFASVT